MVHFQYPDDLAEEALAGWENRWETLNKPPKKPNIDHLKKILNIAYHASFLEEEGRQISFHILIKPDDFPKTNGAHSSRYIEFRDAIRLTPEKLRKIALSVPVDQSRIVVKLHQPEMCGIYVEGQGVRLLELDFEEFRVPTWSPIGALSIRVDRPGWLSIGYQGLRIASLENGIISFPDDGKIASTSIFYAALLEKFKKNPNFATAPFVPVRMLQAAVYRIQKERHGGGIAIIENSANNVSFDYPCNDTGGEISLYKLCQSYNALLEESNLELEDLRNAYRDRINIISSMARVDGIVCLDSKLNIVGYGGFIEELDKVNELDGSRHRSAKAFCRNNADSIIIIVSQDGKISAFSSDMKYNVKEWGAQAISLNSSARQ